jgi:hypothetical protein
MKGIAVQIAAVARTAEVTSLRLEILMQSNTKVTDSGAHSHTKWRKGHAPLFGSVSG